MTKYKRYQYYATNGEIKWTKWFEHLFSNNTPKHQYDKKLLNEYKTENKN